MRHHGFEMEVKHVSDMAPDKAHFGARCTRLLPHGGVEWLRMEGYVPVGRCPAAVGGALGRGGARRARHAGRLAGDAGEAAAL